MSGIAAYGCYLPLRRLPLALLQGRKAIEDGLERTVAWADEDAVTMAVAAARDCLAGRSRDAIDLVLFASTTYAFAEKQGARIVARALGLPASVQTVDVAHSLRGGTQALRAAFDAVAAGRAREALVVTADCRTGAPGSDIERNGGDAGVAFLVSASDRHHPHLTSPIEGEGHDQKPSPSMGEGWAGVTSPPVTLATLIGAVEQGEEIVDTWRRADDRFVHSWEERFVTQHGYLEPALKAGRALKDRFNALQPESWLWAISAPDARSHGTVAKKIGTDISGYWGKVGFAGAADALLQLAGALDSAQSGSHVALLSGGDGAEALLFAVSQKPERPVLAPQLKRRKQIDSLDRYRRARDLTIPEYPPADDQGISATAHFRERDEDLSLIGQVCACGTHQFPKGRVCVRCGQRDRFQPVSYAEATGRIVTYTLDAFFPSPDSPVPVAIVAVDDGPRIHMQMADIDAKDVAIGLPVRFAFRRIHQVGRRPNYFWKAIPLTENQP
jgi:3-hydroxy-3-methylglutaryl CoA synthase/uncharacterized OB-fold protein